MADLTDIEDLDGDPNDVCLAKTVLQLDGAYKYHKQLTPPPVWHPRMAAALENVERLLREATVYADEVLSARAD